MRLYQIINEAKPEEFLDKEYVDHIRGIERAWAKRYNDEGFINQDYDPKYLARMKYFIDNVLTKNRDADVDELWEWFVLANRRNNWNAADYFGWGGYDTIKNFLGKGDIKKKEWFKSSEINGQLMMDKRAEAQAKDAADRLISKVSGYKNKSYVEAGKDLLKYVNVVDLKDILKEIANDFMHGYPAGARMTLSGAYTTADVFEEISIESYNELKKIVDDVVKRHNIYDNFYYEIED